MANYTKVVPYVGLDLLTAVANAAGTLELTQVRAGDGAIGAGDPAELEDIISQVQSTDVVDVREDSNGKPYIYFQLSNYGLSSGYTRREVAIFGRLAGEEDNILLLYLYAPTDADADYIPEPIGVAAVQLLECRSLKQRDYLQVF